MNLDEHKKQFGKVAEDYTKYRKSHDPKLYEFFFSLLDNEQKKVLDIGCGTGKSTESLVRENTEVFGCDIDPLMIDEAKKQAEIKNLNIDYNVAEVENLPYADGEFDVVVVGNAFHWFINTVAITEIKRVLKQGGLLFVFWPMTVKDVPEEDAIPKDFFKGYYWEKVPEELRDIDNISNFLRENELQKVSTFKIPTTSSYTVEEYVGLMKTSANFGNFSPEDKTRFTNELTGILTKQLGNREKFVLDDELQVVYGFKK